MRRCLAHQEKNTRNGDQELGLGAPGQRRAVGLAAQRDVALVGLEDREGDVGRADDPPQLGPGDEAGQVERVVDQGGVGEVVGGLPLHPVRRR